MIDFGGFEKAASLLDAVDELTLPRMMRTVIPEGDYRETEEAHTEEHPPLLELLLAGTGISKASASSAIRIPIDADALEMWGQIRDCIRLWCKQLKATFDQDDLLGSTRRWYLAHSNAHRARKVSDVIDHDVTLMVQGWVRMIENKFDPPEKREWKDACPAMVPTRNAEGVIIGERRCNARRITINDTERFAIELNVTTWTAECARCHTKWEGVAEVSILRFMTNVWNMELAEIEADRLAALEALANPDTPEFNTGKVVA